MVHRLLTIPKATTIIGMEIILNSQLKNVDAEFNIQQLIDMELADNQKGIAVAVNSSVVPKTEWSNHKLDPNDNVLIIKATQGG